MVYIMNIIKGTNKLNWVSHPESFQISYRNIQRESKLSGQNGKGGRGH